MFLAIDHSDVVILSIAAACMAAAAILELLRVVIPDVYEWAADHHKIRSEIRQTRSAIEKTLENTRQLAALRDRRNAERFRLKSTLNRNEMQLATLERERLDIWHELGEPVVGETLFIARVSHRIKADRASKDFDSAPVTWRFTNLVRIWAANDRQARVKLQEAFPAAEGYSTSDVAPVQGPQKSPGPPKPQRSQGDDR